MSKIESTTTYNMTQFFFAFTKKIIYSLNIKKKIQKIQKPKCQS
jgi:hypothetical protein